MKKSGGKLGAIAAVATIIGTIVAILAFLWGSGILVEKSNGGNSTSASENSADTLFSSSFAGESASVSDIPSNEKLSITITEYEFSDKFYYEYPDPHDPKINCFIDYKKGIHGKFSYSRELTPQEKENWYHGGTLYDADGNEIGSEENYPSFFSDWDGVFAVEFPKDMPAGTYTYELHQEIDGQSVSDRITFTIS